MQNNKDQIVHILGASYNQECLIKAAKSLGYKVLVTDMYENPPCKDLADFFEQVNTVDENKTLSVAKKYKISAITTDQTDVAVKTVAFVAQELKLKGLDYQKAINFTNKYAMKKKLQDFLPERYQKSIVPFYFSKDETEVRDKVRGLFAEYKTNKLVIKPINSQGSKGVFIINKTDTEESLEKILDISFKESFSEGIVIEPFIGGYETAIESFTYKAKTQTLCISRKHHYENNPCLDQRVEFFGDLAPELEKRIEEINNEVIHCLGLDEGITHAEYKIYENEVYLIEIAARGAGTNVSGKIVPYLSEFNTNENIIKLSLGLEPQTKISDYHNRFAVLDFINLEIKHERMVKKVEVDDRINTLVNEYRINIKKGDIIKQSRDSRTRVGHLIILSDQSPEDVKTKLNEARSLIKIQYE